jgi:hypothetical protein
MPAIRHRTVRVGGVNLFMQKTGDTARPGGKCQVVARRHRPAPTSDAVKVWGGC